jgi:hypothetical protein
MNDDERRALVARVNSLLRSVILLPTDTDATWDVCFYSKGGTVLFPIRPGNRYHMTYLNAPKKKLHWGIALKTNRLDDEHYLMRRINRELKRFESYLKTPFHI